MHRVTFAGTHHVKPKALLGKLALEQTSWVPLAPKRYLDPFTLQLDRQRIEAYYHVHGFFGARVVSVEVKPRTPPPPKSVDVHIIVEEGPLTKIADVKLTGLEGLGGERGAFAGGIVIKRGDPFNSDTLSAWIDHISGQLKAAGYAWAKVDGGADVDRDARAAHIHVEVTPGPLVTVGRIKFTGDTDLVATGQLEGHVGLAKGALLTPDALEDARGRLYALGIFSSVKVEGAPIAGRPELAEVILELHRGPLNELRLGGGVGIEFQRNEVHLRGVYTRRNFLGGLRSLRLTLEPAYVAIPAIWNVQRHGPAGKAELQFTQPDLGWSLLELKVTVGYDLGIDYAYQYHGPRAQLALARPFLGERLRLGISYNFLLLLFFNTDPAILGDPAQARRLFGYTDPYRLAWLQQDLSLDLRDRPIDGRKGVFLALTVEEGGAYTGSAFQYEKLMPEARGYVPLGDRVMLAGRLQFGQMFVQGDLGSPITRRFYLGGPDSHRGFGYNRLSPQVPSGLPGVPDLPTGGDQMLLAQLELRVYMFRIFDSWMEGAVFLDAGDVAGPTCQNAAGVHTACEALAGFVSDRIDFRHLHVATGAGLRFKTIIGTIRADVGVRLNRVAAFEDDGVPNPDPGGRVALHLSIGEPF